MSHLKRFDEFINESTPNQKDTVLTKFKSKLGKASHDKHDIESAYEEIMDEYKEKYPQFSKDFDAAFASMDKDARKKLDETSTYLRCKSCGKDCDNVGAGLNMGTPESPMCERCYEQGGDDE